MESYRRFGKARGASGFFAEVMITPKIDPAAVEIIRSLKAWGSRVRLMETGSIDRMKIDCGEYDARCIIGGMLLQRRDLVRGFIHESRAAVAPRNGDAAEPPPRL